MFVVMITPECASVAKVGGLGDVVQGLAQEIAMRGHDVEVILPKYDCMRYDRIWGLTKTYENLAVPFYNIWINCDVYFGFVDGIKCFFIEPHSEHNFFHRGKYYGDADDVMRFGFFSRAALEFMLKTNKQADIIHCHDWQTGLVPVLLYEIYHHIGMSRTRACYTLHNLGHQGITGKQVLEQNGLNIPHLMTPERMLDPVHPNAVNLMKGGIVFSNFVTTVSPTYAYEIQYTEQGMGLQSTLQTHSGKLGGVLNGINYSVWNPEIDAFIPQHYNIDSLPDKVKNKRALRQRLMLRDEFKPLIAVVSRLDKQKGTDLILHGIYYALSQQAQFVLLGAAAENSINAAFWKVKHELNDNPDCHLEIGYDEELAHLIYAGADMILIPSIYEPCGLTQMIGLKYGTVPIVRGTGGLADTVFDANHSDKAYEQRNGYVFEHSDNLALESAMNRAIGLWYKYPRYFRQLRVNGMRQDHSWNQPGSDYINIYQYIKA
jgi:starch synthase